MSNPLSSLKRFLPAAPPCKVVLLPDALFFVRAVPVAGVETAADVATQVELALEVIAPFSLAQLYYGHHWKPGADHALVFAAYRKRFTSDDVEIWAGAEVVIPAFTALLKEAPAAATTLLINGADSLTAVHYGDSSGVPTQVRSEPLSGEATESERTVARNALLRPLGGTIEVTEINEPAQFDPLSPQGEFIFRSGEFSARFTSSEIESLDVRDKIELAARRRAHARDIILWRTFLGAAAAIVLALFLEVALVGSSLWQKQRLAVIAQQTPVVNVIMTSQSLATRIDELSSKRLMPFEMLAVLNSKRPASIQFMRTVTTALNKLEVEAQTASSADINTYRAALNELPECEKAEVLDPRSRDGLSTFRLVVTFKPDAFKAEVAQQ
ncbi:MAG TPA: hypothetical protein VL357_04715 [Rariglobus sp.]|nr:hypothetical protein [Rariglobus sp.]